MKHSTPSLGLLLLLSACRGDPGTADYSGHVGLNDPDLCADLTPAEESSNPFSTGDVRADVGIFYEGGASERFPLSMGRNFFIFPAGDSFTTAPSTERVEGCESEAIVLTGSPAFWGGGVVYEEAGVRLPEDFSAYDTLRVSFLSGDPTFSEVTIEINTQGGNGQVSANTYGYQNDDMWHDLTVPLADFGTVDLSQMTAPFIISGQGNVAGERLLVDDLYYEQSSPN
ncbi:MAG: hypothetical protein AAGD10_09925 [Myxococcota bacterium]